MKDTPVQLFTTDEMSNKRILIEFNSEPTVCMVGDIIGIQHDKNIFHNYKILHKSNIYGLHDSIIAAKCEEEI